MENTKTCAECRAQMFDVMSRVVESQCVVIESLARAVEERSATVHVPPPLPDVEEIFQTVQRVIDKLKQSQGFDESDGEG